MSRRPAVALVTDFGERDPYAAAMKLVIAARCDADLIDLTHEIAPGALIEAAWFLRSIAAYAGPVVVVCVVDPGVGTSRRLLAARKGTTWWLAPDNGVLSLVIDDSFEVRSIENEALFLPDGSSTFHGRDRFAPAAAFLASGGDAAALGPELPPGAICTLPYEPPSRADDVVTGTVVSIDRFGNLVTDIVPEGDLSRAELRAGAHAITDFAATYDEGSAAEPFMIVGSQGTIEISLRRKSAADILQLSRGDRISLCLNTK